MALCSRCTYPSIHFFVSRSRSVVWQAHIQAFTLKLPQDHGRLSIVRISKHSLFSWRRHSQDHGRLSGVCMWRVWVVCVHVWCVVKLGTLSLSCSFSYSCSCSCSFSFSSLFSCRHQTLWKETINQHGGQDRGIWMWSGAGQVHGSRFSPSSSPLHPPSSLPPTGTFYYRNISGEGIIFDYNFK